MKNCLITLNFSQGFDHPNNNFHGFSLEKTDSSTQTISGRFFPQPQTFATASHNVLDDQPMGAKDW